MVVVLVREVVAHCVEPASMHTFVVVCTDDLCARSGLSLPRALTLGRLDQGHRLRPRQGCPLQLLLNQLVASVVANAWQWPSLRLTHLVDTCP